MGQRPLRFHVSHWQCFKIPEAHKHTMNLWSLGEEGTRFFREVHYI